MIPSTQLAEDLAAAVAMVSHDDLPALAQIHLQLQTLAADLPPAPDDTGPRAQATQASDLVQQIVLGEVKDAAEAVRQLNLTVSALLKLISGQADSAAPSQSKASNTAPAAPSTSHAPPVTVSEADLTLNPADLPLITEFLGEAAGHIESSEAALLDLEANPDNAEAVNTMFRGFHTIKGVAGFLNLQPITALAHSAENLLDLARHGELKLSGPVVDVVLASIDLTKTMLQSLRESMSVGRLISAPPALAPLVQRLAECVSRKATAAEATAIPSPAPIAAACPAISAAKPAPNPGPTQTPAAPLHSKSIEPPAQEPAPAQAAKTEAGATATAAPAETVVKVATERLDSLINAIGELVIAQSMVRQDVLDLAPQNHRVARNLNHLGKIARELQELSMSMRMVPIHGTFQKMVRLVRDVARKAGKEIELEIIGGETELDRGLVEAIGDPLVHMVRNSCDHGIEPPEVRQQSGKPRTGHVTLKAYHQAGHVVIEISDDGKGLVKSRIRKKAVENGLVASNAELSEQEIFKLIFAAGLSTAEKVTDISGRGVGMDVVRKNVEALRGRIDIASVEGKGSTFTIRLPLTLAVIDGLIVRVGPERYILPLTSIERSVQPTADQLTSVQDRGEMCLIHGDLMPLFRLHRLFNVTPRTENPTESLVVIVHDGEGRCGLLVDDVVGQQQVVIKSLGDGIGRVLGIAGGAILGDGNVSLILDVPGIIERAISH